MAQAGKIEIVIDLTIYDKVAALKTCYLFQDRFHTSLQPESGSIAVATLMPKQESVVLKNTEQEFKNELIDQQIRLENEKLFSGIRKLIIEQAFKPMSYSDLKNKLKT